MSATAPARKAALAALCAGALALVAHAWMLGLPLRQDDFLLLADPLGLFERVARAARDGGSATIFYRPAPWGYWALLRALGGEPVAAWPFLLAGLFGHAATAALLAAVLTRVAGARAGLLGGGLFALCAGALQAAHWPSATGDLFVALFSLAALAAFLAERPGLAVALLAAGVLSKASVLFVAPAVPACVAALRGWRAARAAALGTALLLGCALAARLALVGGVGWSAAAATSLLPPWYELLAKVPAVFAQALTPVERAPEFADLAPLAARVAGERAPWLGALWVLPLALALALAPRARPRLCFLLVLAGLAALPAAALFPGMGTNHQSRNLYPALVPFFAAVAVALDALLARGRSSSVAASAIACLLALHLADGALHVARVERTAAGILTANRAALVAAAEEHQAQGAARPLDVLLVRGIEAQASPLLLTAATLDAALKPPFREGAPLSVLGVPSRAELEARLSALELATLDAAVFGPDPAAFVPPPARGAERRRELLLRRWTPTALGLRASSDLERVACVIAPEQDAARDDAPSGARGTAWKVSFGEPLPGTAARIVELAFDAGPAARVEVTARYSADAAPALLELAASEQERVVVFTLTPELAQGFEPLRELVVRGAVPRAARFLAELPEALVHLDGALLELDPSRPPRFELVLPEKAEGAPWVRLELYLHPPAERLPLCTDATLAGVGEGAGRESAIELELVHFQPRLFATPSSLYPWSEVLEDHVLPRLKSRDVRTGSATFRVRVFHSGGLEAARSPWSTVPYRVP